MFKMNLDIECKNSISWTINKTDIDECCDEEINIYHHRKCLKSDHLNTITLIILEMEHCIMAGSIVNRYTLSIYINDILEKLFNKIFFEELSSVQNFEQKKM